MDSVPATVTPVARDRGNWLSALLRADLRNIRRDTMLRFFVVYPLLLGLVLRWLIPFAQRGLAEIYDITPLYPLLVSFFGILISPMLAGVLIGFLLLDERDARTLTALQVTPLPLTHYMGYRLLLPILIAFVSIFLIVPLMGIMAVPWPILAACGLVAALGAPLVAMLLVLISSNKVQGLALMKGISFFFSGPFIAWFVPLPWQYLFGLLPTYWVMKGFWVWAAGGVWWPWLAGGALYQGILLLLLVRRFREGVYKTQ